MDISDITRLLNAMVHLLKPLVEIVIHDLDSGTIQYINGSISKRKIGDASLIEDVELDSDLASITYPKMNFDGRLVKSVSVPLGQQFIVCINCDVSIFTQMQALGNQILETNGDNAPERLFKNDWQEKLHISVNAYIKMKNWVFEQLTRPQKKEIAMHLFNIGAFNEKNAADYFASILKIGRATIFNYLKEWKNTR